jgi:uncharacterized Zn finger protein
MLNETPKLAEDYATADEYAAALCEANGARYLADGEYGVKSSSGDTEYTVRYSGRGDDSAVLWTCTCPAGQHGRTCKHVRLIAAINDDVCSNFGLE